MKAPDCVCCFTGMRAFAHPLSSSRFPRQHASSQQSHGKLAHSRSSQWDVLSTVSTAASENDTADPTLADAPQEDLNRAAALQAIVEADDVLLTSARRHQGAESLAAFCMRYTRARPRSQAQALELLTADMKYRDETQSHRLAHMSLQEALGLSVSPDAEAIQKAVCRQVPHSILGLDRQGRVVVYRRYSLLRIWELETKGIGAKEMVRHHQWVTEKCLHAMGHKGRWVQIVDISGACFSQASARAHLSFARMLADLDAAHYPERLAQIFVINAPPFFSGTFKLVSSWLDERTRARVQLLGGPEAWQEPISRCLDLHLLPRELGGETDLTFESQIAPAVPLISRAPSRSISSSASVSSFWAGLEDEDEDKGKCMAKVPPTGLQMSSKATSADAGASAGQAAMTSRSSCSLSSAIIAATVVFMAISIHLIFMEPLMRGQ